MVHDVCMDRNTKLSSLRIKEIKEILDKAGWGGAYVLRVHAVHACMCVYVAYITLLSHHTKCVTRGILCGLHGKIGIIGQSSDLKRGALCI